MTPTEDQAQPAAGDSHCPACGERAAAGTTLAPCERCGRGDWFSWSEDGERVLRPKGDLIHAHLLDQFLQNVPLQPGGRLIVDLADVRFIASEALGRLLALRKRVLASQGRLILRHVDPDIAEVFRVTRLASFFEFEP